MWPGMASTVRYALTPFSVPRLFEFLSKGPVTECRLHLQVGGSLDSLHAHITAVRCHDLFGDDIDFKLAASRGPASEQAVSETGFGSLSVSICEVMGRSPQYTNLEAWHFLGP